MRAFGCEARAAARQSRVVSPWFSASLRARASVLAPTAERFLEDWLGEQASSFRGGAEGLRALCRHMELFVYRDDVGEEAERRFVEGAGALLGVLLIDHLGDAEHSARGAVHRLRLGRHGFFDPFAAIDRALDARDIRAELAQQVALAEAEARACGPVSRVVHALLGAIERERTDLTYDAQFECSLWLRSSEGEPVEIDLRRAVDSTRDQGAEAVANVAQRLLAMLPGAPEASVGLDEVRARLVPRIARADALRELARTHPLHAQPLTEELQIALLIEFEGRARYVQQRELDAWGLDDDEARRLALDNLATRSAQARLATTDTEHGPLLVARTGDGRDSARVLLGGLYRALAERLGQRICVGVPHRDTFFACSASNQALQRELARRTAHDAERAPHRLSARVFELTSRGLREARA